MPRTILLVDDSPTIRSITKIYLMGLGVEFIEADNGQRALQLLRLLCPDLVIADVLMPVMGGIELLQALRNSNDERTRKVPVVLLTSSKDEETKAQGYGAGANAFVNKPVTATALIDTVTRLLAGAPA